MSTKAIHESEISKTAVTKGQVRLPPPLQARRAAPRRTACRLCDSAPRAYALTRACPFAASWLQVLIVATSCGKFADGTPTGLW